MSLLNLALSLLNRGATTEQAKLRASLARTHRLTALLPYAHPALLIAAAVYLLLLPSVFLARDHYVSENALQPAQVNTYWNWADVHVADSYAKSMDRWVTLPLGQRSTALLDAFQSLGLPAATQSYTYTFPNSNTTITGTNVYAILRAPKTDGAEALVLSASWLSRALGEDGEKRINVRGVALVLALANYLKKYSMWSKDIVFLVSDSYTEGAQAWLDAYHGYSQPHLSADELRLATGPIWAALNVDYPYHSFEGIGLFFEGANGHLPNLDYLNTASHIIQYSGVPVHLSPSPSHPSVPPLPLANDAFFLLSNEQVQNYARNAVNLWRQLRNGAVGKGSGPEGVYGRYRIDAITLFGVPADGPHGFHAFGRTIESTFRSLNNLLERFHQSFFLYLMTSVTTFVTVGNYLAAPILVSAGMTIKGLEIVGGLMSPAVRAAGGQEVRSVGWGKGLMTLGACEAVGMAMYALLLRTDPFAPLPSIQRNTMLLLLLLTPPLFSLVLSSSATLLKPTRLAPLLRGMALMLGGLTIAIASTLNIGLAIFLSLLALPLSLPLFTSRTLTVAYQAAYLLVNPVVLWLLWELVDRKGANEFLGEVLLEAVLGESWLLKVLGGVVVPVLLLGATAGLL